MSPFLFLLITEGLSRAVKEFKREGAIKRIKVGRSLSLSHLLFVDDVILFGLGIVREAEKYKKILDLYCRARGMEINAHKSTILFNEL
jgi:hypothetical protein